VIVIKFACILWHTCTTTLLYQYQMITTTKKCYANTKCENTYIIYHATLTQLMLGKTVEWILTTKIPGEERTQDTVVYKWWIKPENSLNDIFCKKWKGQPIGNSPEVMPHNTCLFRDIKEPVQRKVATISLNIRYRCQR